VIKTLELQPLPFFLVGNQKKKTHEPTTTLGLKQPFSHLTRLSSSKKYVTFVLKFILLGISFGHDMYPFKESLKLVLWLLENLIIM
jgi:hypothetical protein